MTPATAAIRVAERANIPHRVLSYAHDPAAAAYGLEAAAALGVDPRVVFKTLVLALEGVSGSPGTISLAVALVPAHRQLDLKAAAHAFGAKRAALADVTAAERATGYVAGGISPLGQRRQLPTIVDASALEVGEMYVSAGRRGLELALAPAHLLELTRGITADVAR